MRTSTIGRAMRHQHWLISGLALVGAGLALIAAFLRPATYEGSALLSIDQTQEAGQGFDVAMQTDQFLTQRFISMAGSQVVLNQVCSEEGPGCSTAALARQVRATTPRATGQVQVLADSSEPITAARLANEVADAVVARNQALADEASRTQRTYLETQLKQLNDRVTATLAQVQAAEAVGRTDTASISQLSLLQTQYASTYQRLQDLDVQRARQAGLLSVQQRAYPPGRPIDPDPLRYLVVGVAAGAVLGFLSALLAESLRSRIRYASELAEAAGSPLVIDVTARGSATAPGSYGYLARAVTAGRRSPDSLLLVGTTLRDRVNDVGLELARALADEHDRVLLVLAPADREDQPGRRELSVGDATVVVLPPMPGPFRRSPGDGFDVAVRCAPPPMYDAGAAWLRPSPQRAIVVGTRDRTRYADARRVAEQLRHVGLDVIATIMVPPRMRPVKLPEPEVEPGRDRAARTKAALER